MNVRLDLETIPQQPADAAKAAIAATILPPASMSKPETIKEWEENAGKYATCGKREAIEEAYHRTGLNGAKGQICSLTFALGDSDDLHTIYAMPPSAHPVDPGTVLNSPLVLPKCELVESEAQLLARTFAELLPELKGRPPYFIGHFLGGFDLRFLFHRCVVNQINPGIGLRHNGRHDSDWFDTMIEWSGFKGSISADDLCVALGIDAKVEDEIDGAGVWQSYQEGRHDRIIQHNQQDVLRLGRIYRRLKFLR